MRTIGLIGGMSWESTVTYYSIINESVSQSLGGLHSAKIALYSVDFDEVEKLQSSGKWDAVAEIIADAAVKLERAGADFILICTNTIHKVYPQIQSAVSIPVIHIAEATADVLASDGVRKVALLGTKYTMQGDFYKDKLKDKGFEVLIPGDDDVEIINDIIFSELCLGVINPDSKAMLEGIIGKLKDEGAEAVILGCTEIGLLVDAEGADLPLYDTTVIHAKKAAELAIE